MTLRVVDAGVMGYRAAWDRQLQLHEEVQAGGEGHGGFLMLVEHPAVITVGRRPDAQKHLLASPAMLEARGVELVETDRGGDITFHGPGQLVAYPIINLNTYKLNLHGYMRLLESVVIETLSKFNLQAVRVPNCTGVWIRDHAIAMNGGVAKICAIGVKLRRWVTLHGLALNVTTDMSFFELINPCGLSKPVTSMQRLLHGQVPGMGEVKGALAGAFEADLWRVREGHAPVRGSGGDAMRCEST
jgi:lipoate-protein ligase B